MNSTRQPKGIPAGGQFAATGHGEAPLSLPARAAPQMDLPDDPFRGHNARCPEPRPQEWVFGKDESIDAAVGTVFDGPLSRGVVNAQRRAAFNAWHDWAMEKAQAMNDPAYRDFAAGLRTGVAALYERRMGHYEPGMDRFKLDGPAVYVADHALQLSGSKRASAEDREHWRKLLKHAPTEEWHRGHVAAGLILSGADGYWGLREDPAGAVTAPLHS